MITRLNLVLLMLLSAGTVQANEVMLLDFKLSQGDELIEQGRLNVTREPHTWSKGVKRSYLRLRCEKESSGKLSKLYSTEDHFHGITLTHRVSAKKVVIKLERNLVQPRLIEIRALGKNECREMSPVVTTTSENYSLPATDNVSEKFNFGDKMSFSVVLNRIN
ncbi:MAG: hypothetical protein H8E21_06410 [Gammaproteobacteria bacterium]|nr:hypothetical protein [Gammaproteobacteria bacterium]